MQKWLVNALNIVKNKNRHKNTGILWEWVNTGWLLCTKGKHQNLTGLIFNKSKCTVEWFQNSTKSCRARNKNVNASQINFKMCKTYRAALH